MNSIEYLGLVATLLVVASFLFQNIVLIRGVNAIGAALWVVYGILRGSPSVVLLNAIVIGIQLVQLIRLKTAKLDNVPVGTQFKIPVLKQ